MKRVIFIILLALGLVPGFLPQRLEDSPFGLGTARAQEKTDRRFGVVFDPEHFPQKTPKECLGSVIKAIDERKIDYLLAQLADPEFVNQHVKAAGGFAEFVKQTSDRLASDPAKVRELKRFLDEGTWEEADDAATARLKDVKGRAVFLKKIENRWYFEDRQNAKEQPKEK